MANMTHISRRRKPEARLIKDAVTQLSPARTRFILAVDVLVIALVGCLFSWNFYNHFIYFNSDFSSFFGEGQSWLAGVIPPNMKRAPLFSVITAMLGHLFKGPARFLAGTEVFNGVLLPGSMILIYLVARRIVNRAAFWIAILAGITPWAVWASSQPLAEIFLTTLFVATIYCVSINTRWAYLFAMLISITRWDFAGAIAAVAIVDMLRNKKILKPVLFGLLSAVPFISCMVITIAQNQLAKAGSGYLQVMAADHSFKLATDLRMYWEVVCSFINAPIVPAEENSDTNFTVMWASGLAVAILFVIGCVMAIRRKKWELIAAIMVFLPYLVLHAFFPFHFNRFVQPMSWVVLLVCGWILVDFWQGIQKENWAKAAGWIMAGIGTIVFIMWALALRETLDLLQQYCPPVTKLAVITSVLLLSAYAVKLILSWTKPSPGVFCLGAFVVLAVVSNCANLGFIMGDGKAMSNFRNLGLWFAENAGPDDKMVSTMPGHMPVYTGMPQERFVHMISTTEANDFEGFIKSCRKLGVTLVAWDSRLGLAKNDMYYKLWGLERIAVLASPFMRQKIDRIGDCKLEAVFSEGTPKIAVWRIMPEQNKSQK